MKHTQWEVIILKPTSVFLSFLSAQLPDIDLPSLNLLQSDTTAYSIPRQDSEEATFDEIERHFSEMFQHEIARCLGEDLPYHIEGSFLDFLCCFKFEMHSRIVLMESSMEEGHQLLCIKPRSVLFKWIKSSSPSSSTAVTECDDDLVSTLDERVNLSHLVENATVVVKNFKQTSDVQPFLQHYYQPIFKAEMSRMCEKSDQWPQVDSFQKFDRYFTVETHTQLICLH